MGDLLLQCTAFDSEWADDDEWNELTQQVVAFLRDEERADSRLADAERKCANVAAVAGKIAVLRQRLRGDKSAVSPPQLERPEARLIPMSFAKVSTLSQR